MNYLSPPGTWYLTSPSLGLANQLLLFIPIYVLSLIPVALFDLSVKSSVSRRDLIGLSALVGPFAGFIDGRYAAGIASAVSGNGVVALGLVAVPMVLGGLVAGLLLTKLSAQLVPDLMLSRSIPSHGPTPRLGPRVGKN